MCLFEGKLEEDREGREGFVGKGEGGGVDCEWKKGVFLRHWCSIVVTDKRCSCFNPLHLLHDRLCAVSHSSPSILIRMRRRHSLKPSSNCIVFSGCVSCASAVHSPYLTPSSHRQGVEGVLAEETERGGGAVSESDSERGNSTCRLHPRFTRQNSILPLLVMDCQGDKEGGK